jgi:hypothetical protein
MTTAHSTWAKKICAAWQDSVCSIIKTGQLLIASKDDLKGKRGEFGRMVENELPFSSSTAQRLMAIARDRRLTNPAHVQLLPPSWGTLYELTKLSNEVFAARIADGTIHAEMERIDAESLVTTYKLKIECPAYASEPQPVKVMGWNQPVPVIKAGPVKVPSWTDPVAETRSIHPVKKAKLLSFQPATATRRQAERVIDDLIDTEELLDEATVKEVVELLRTRGDDLFRVTRALRALADLKTAIDSVNCVQ